MKTMKTYGKENLKHKIEHPQENQQKASPSTAGLPAQGKGQIF
jgi:hypothetical protein